MKICQSGRIIAQNGQLTNIAHRNLCSITVEEPAKFAAKQVNYIITCHKTSIILSQRSFLPVEKF